ncbi:MAG: HTH domain-containing protein [Planctomycetes bacterium]|nr:HTH domain-containing protein [Planctomycetota bacterium]
MENNFGTEQGRVADPRQYERFVSLFAQVHDNLFAYVFSLLPRWSDAEDVFQQTSLVLWRKFGSFEPAAKKGTGPICRNGPEGASHKLAPSPFSPGSDFLAWACRVAFFEVQNFRRTAGRDRLMFDNDLVEQLAEERDVSPQRGGRRRDFLMDCIAKLSEKQRDLLQHAYEGETTIRQLAEQLHRSPQTIYNRLNLIRRELFECVEDAVRQQGTEQ